MNTHQRKNQVVWGATFVAGMVMFAAGVAVARAPITLVINGGTPVSTSITRVNGVTYVPVKDVAKALNMDVTMGSGTITLAPAGGANQIANKTVGKIGDDLFTGKYRFQVQSVAEVPVYKFLYTNHSMTDIQAKAEGNEKLVLVTCRLKNGTKEKDEYVFSTGDYGENTALTDTNEGVYQPAYYDVAADENAPYGKYALPGSAIPFVIVFRVPKTTSVKDLVFTVVRYHERGDKKGTDLRVHLAP